MILFGVVLKGGGKLVVGFLLMVTLKVLRDGESAFEIDEMFNHSDKGFNKVVIGAIFVLDIDVLGVVSWQIFIEPNSNKAFFGEPYHLRLNLEEPVFVVKLIEPLKGRIQDTKTLLDWNVLNFNQPNWNSFEKNRTVFKCATYLMLFGFINMFGLNQKSSSSSPIDYLSIL